MHQDQRVSRALYGELEELAAFGRPCRIAFRAENGGLVHLQAVITRLLEEEGVEWLLTAEGLLIRLDRLTELNGRALSGLA